MQGKNTEMKMSVSTEGHPSAEVHSVHSSRPLLEQPLLWTHDIRGLSNFSFLLNVLDCHDPNVIYSRPFPRLDLQKDLRQQSSLLVILFFKGCSLQWGVWASQYYILQFRYQSWPVSASSIVQELLMSNFSYSTHFALVLEIAVMKD